ncbi:MAG: hypothetical protein HN435_14405 [Nitrospinaceae bacterium]|jgi:hypothetical protein|nr:hypothetical protein [Nitrospinaceae bacterium]MBT3435084.1 hypothetical protein [Nitrospinaceae bacterium]
MMDLGIRAFWYDLPETREEEYIQWLHEEHLPQILARPGFLWAGHYKLTGGGEGMKKVQESVVRYVDDPKVGRGTGYLMMIGALNTDIFFDPNLPQISERWDKETFEMVSLRQGLRTSVFHEQTRVNGPAFSRRPPDTAPGPVIQMGAFNADTPEDEEDLGAWYVQYRLPNMTRIEGCIAARKLLSVSGWGKHSVLYEFTSFEEREMNFEKDQEVLALDETAWTGRIIKYLTHGPGSPSVGQRIWPI